jgi:hypothetical protein
MAKIAVFVRGQEPVEIEVDRDVLAEIEKNNFKLHMRNVGHRYKTMPYVQTGRRPNDYEYLSRFSLKIRDNLDTSKNVLYRDGNHHNVTRKNLYQVS